MFRDAVSHIVLPAALLGYFSLAYISRMTRSFMLEQLSSEYVTTARVKGALRMVGGLECTRSATSGCRS